MKFSFSLVLTFLFVYHGFSQSKPSQNAVVYPSVKVNPSVYFSEYKHELGIQQASDFVLEKTGFSKFTKNHLRYQQKFNNIPVYGHYVFLHTKEGLVDHITGQWAKNIDIPFGESLDSLTIINRTKEIFSEDQISDVTTSRDFEINHFEKIIIDRSFPQISGFYKLAYDVHISSLSNQKYYQYILDATNGNVLFSQNLECTYFPKGTAPSYHYGTVEIETEQVEPNKFVLRDVTRGNGNSTFVNTSSGDIMLSDDDNVWEKPSVAKLAHVAYDAHYATMKFYDFLVDRFDYSGINGNGRSMIARVNINNGADLVNASWNNQNAAFGNGNCHYHPLTTFSIVGHEFAHGITSENAKLVYSNESGALNEAFSDIIGKAFEKIVDPDNFEWPIGHEIVATRFARPLRSMQDPNIYNNPKMYKGKHWRDGGSVHSNSGVLNHWFYLLVEGGSGKNEVDTSYAVVPVDMQDILDIVFLCQTSYLMPGSTYPDMYSYSLLACESLFGKNSQQYRSLEQAWKAVGLPYEDVVIENYDDIAISAKIKNDPNNSYTCYLGQQPEINMYFINRGTIVYPEGHVFTFTMTHNGETITKMLSLPKELAPDSTVIVPLPEFKIVDKTEYFSIEINLVHPDQVASNNRFYLYFQNYATSGVEYAISGVSHKEVDCFSNEVVFSVRIRNNSCFTAPAGTTFVLNVNDLDKNKTFTFNHTNQGAMAPRQETVVSATLPYDWVSLNFSYDFSCAIDVDPSNNTSQYTLLEKGVIESSKTFTFENTDFDEIFRHNTSFSSFLYEGDHYFRSKNNFSSTNLPCLDQIDNFKVINGGLSQYTIAEACLDVTGMVQPAMRFDMRQFRSEVFNDFPELGGNSTILKLEFLSPSGNFTPETFVNSAQGFTQEYTLPLPKDFKGKFRIIAFTSRHDGTSNINVKNDVILLDNLSFFDIVSSENPTISEIMLTPNPANDRVKITSYDQLMYDFVLRDITGKEMLLYSFPNGVKELYLPVQNLVSGTYLVEILTEGGRMVKKLIR